MTDYSTMTRREESKTSVNNNRRRITDKAQPLDYVTKELVSDFIESQPRDEQPLKSFFQKILRAD